MAEKCETCINEMLDSLGDICRTCTINDYCNYSSKKNLSKSELEALNRLDGTSMLTDSTDEAREYLKTVYGPEFHRYIDTELAGDFAVAVADQSKAERRG